MLEFIVQQIPAMLFSIAIMFPAKYLHSRVLGCLSGMAVGLLFIVSAVYVGGDHIQRAVANFFYLAIGGFIWGRAGMKKK